MPDEKNVASEIEEMLTALGEPAPKVDEDEDLDKDKDQDTNKDKDTDTDKDKDKDKDEDQDQDKDKDKDKDKDEDERDDEDKDEDENNLEENKKKETDALTQIQREKQEREESEKAKEEARKAEADKKKKDEEPLTLEEQDFIGDLDLEEGLRDKAVLNKILNTVYAKGVNDAKKISTEKVLMTIPDIVKHNVTVLTSLKEAANEFYEKNKDLSPFKKVVAAVFEETAAKNTDKTYEEIMTIVAPEARKRLSLQKKATNNEEKEKGERKGPRLPNAKGGQRAATRTKPDTSDLSKEIEEMNKQLGR
jgi:hypothetical protein